MCGAGAVGSNLVDNLARQGAENLCVVDRDRVEEHNVSTQVWGSFLVTGLDKVFEFSDSVSTALATLVAVPLGIVMSRRPLRHAGTPILFVANIGQRVELIDDVIRAITPIRDGFRQAVARQLAEAV